MEYPFNLYTVATRHETGKQFLIHCETGNPLRMEMIYIVR